MRAIFSIVAVASVCLLPVAAFAQDVSGFEARTFKGTTNLTLPYRLFKVKNPTAGTKYPLILFLHGAGERGDNNTSQLMANAGATVWATDAHQAKNPAYVIAPQCPADKQWVDTDWGLGSYSTTTVPVSDQLTTALEIADAVEKEFDTDPTRRYLTGLSMGGYGTWDSLIRNPDRFAAAIPISGAGDPSKAELIKDLPIWTFHGDMDPTVPVKGSRDMVAALKAVNSPIKYTEYPGVQHDAWDMTYANEDVIDWLFTFQKAAPPTGGSGGMGGSDAMGGTGGSATGGANAGTTSGGSATAGSATAGSATGGSGTGGSTSGETAGSSAAGVASTSAGTGGSAAATTSPASDNSGCSYRGATSEQQQPGRVLLLGGLGMLLVYRRRHVGRLGARSRRTGEAVR